MDKRLKHILNPVSYLLTLDIIYSIVKHEESINAERDTVDLRDLKRLERSIAQLTETYWPVSDWLPLYVLGKI